MQSISAETVNLALSFPKLINSLERAFTENIIETVPKLGYRLVVNHD